MDITLFLSKFLGLYLIFASFALIKHGSLYLTGLSASREDAIWRPVIAIIDTIIGLAIVLTHNQWSSIPEILISTAGWITLAKGLAIMYVPNEMLNRCASVCASTQCTILIVTISLLAGLYLTSFGFGLWY